MYFYLFFILENVARKADSYWIEAKVAYKTPIL